MNDQHWLNQHKPDTTNQQKEEAFMEKVAVIMADAVMTEDDARLIAYSQFYGQHSA